MTIETLMTQATTTTEGQPASQPAAEQPATGAGDDGQQQQQQPTQEQGAQGQQPAADASKTQGEDKAKPHGATEQYEFQVPEGVALDDGVLGAFSEVARELNLPQDKAQRVLDKMLPVMQTRHAEQIGEFYADIGGLPETWVASSTVDKEFGGDKLEENLAMAKKARDAFGTPELTTLLNKTGLGNHPEIIRVFYRAGLAISEDRLVVGHNGNPPKQGDAQRLYAASNMNP
ncbi:protease [Bordetella avium]|nr:protease [Bordetella avium]RIQ16082.1 protease [Bordetella avium]RIQ47608.1 protease [Bordetella avium]